MFNGISIANGSEFGIRFIRNRKNGTLEERKMGGPANRKAAFLEKIKPFVQPGDVINFDSDTEWYNLHLKLAYSCIRKHQKKLFGVSSRWRDTHTMLYFEDTKILSVEPPRTRWAKLQDFYDDNITIYRYTKRELSAADMAIMREPAKDLIGSIYDVGQLLDMLINRLMGYPHTIEYRVFDFSKYCKVCSVGARVCFEHLRKKLKEQGDDSMQRLFSRFKYDTWEKRRVILAGNTEYRGVDVEATTPAHFANTDWFDDEFQRVAEFRNGQRLFPEPTPPADGGQQPHDDH
jgi:hypothetical protein